MVSLEGRKVVIVGGSYGMGYATAQMAIDAGAEVAIAARGEGKLAAAAQALQARGGREVRSQALQVEDRPAVARFLAACAPFDHLVLPGSTVKPILYDDLTDEVRASRSRASSGGRSGQPTTRGRTCAAAAASCSSPASPPSVRSRATPWAPASTAR